MDILKKNNYDEKLALYLSCIDKFVPSDDMRKYLLEGHSSVDDIVDIIFYSPAGYLNEKRDAIAGVLKIATEDELKEKCRNAILFLEKAMEFLESDGIFVLESRYFSQETKQQDGCFEAVFSSFSDAKEEMQLWEEGEDHWFEITLWDKDEKGKMDELASYIIVKNRPVYCSIKDSVLENAEGFNKEYLWNFEMLSMTDLNLPVPFKAGDIVEVGSLPFVPRQRILITDVGDNRDCCSIQGLGKLSNGEYAVGAVKHGHVGIARSDCYILPSLLYEMTKYDGPLNDDEQILNEVAWIIKAKEYADKSYAKREWQYEEVGIDVKN